MARYFAIFALVACSAGDDVPAPMISAITPAHAPPGVSVTITGDYFCQQPETGSEEDPLACANIGTVEFGSTPATIGIYTEQMIMAEVPALEPGRIGVAISVGGRRSRTIDFVVDTF